MLNAILVVRQGTLLRSVAAARLHDIALAHQFVIPSRKKLRAVKIKKYIRFSTSWTRLWIPLR